MSRNGELWQYVESLENGAESVRQAVERDIDRLLKSADEIMAQYCRDFEPTGCLCRTMVCEGGLACPHRPIITSTYGPGWPD
jgi:hypothetical protein